MTRPASRFWDTVTVARDPEDGLFRVRLDGRPFRLPGGTELAVATEGLAEAIAREWDRIPKNAAFRSADLGLTQMVGTQIERVASDRDQIIGGLCAFGESDLLCYRATGALGRMQDEVFDPVLDAFAARYGIRPPVTRSMMPVAIDPALAAAFAGALRKADDAELAAASVLAPATGSLILALGLVEGWVAPEAACAMASLEERYQMKEWGEDEALLDEIARQDADIRTAMRFLALSRGGASTVA
ncbi:ATP12 family protein [Swaminathania salitolerans]|uniref:ATPase n=1 Tax=Swaminathania salitolerans TaxID=182838 RepID=A0A511BMQ5_9PROT|nr:ATP12 family protein [Swaminathania salitolerans]GBQ10581.1 ATP synthase F1 mitochondrial assembly chaperone ATP12 [Swaminathania salitolerans LMG 21291]GEL01342.1 ATPase [Swaminathania salitolerans]